MQLSMDAFQVVIREVRKLHISSNADQLSEHLLGSSWVALFTFVALMVSAIAQAANHSISLYNTIIVLYLCYLHLSCQCVLFFLSIPKKTMGPGATARFAVNALFLLPLWFWSSFGFYVWVQARTFGSQPECNAVTKVIFFGRALSATGSGRVVCLGE